MNYKSRTEITGYDIIGDGHAAKLCLLLDKLGYAEKGVGNILPVKPYLWETGLTVDYNYKRRFL